MGHQIKINKLVVQGEAYQRTFHFSKGLNIISGDAYTGKSLILKCINYCLGDSDPIPAVVQRELFEYCDRVYLEMQIEDLKLTLLRELKTQVNHIYVFFCEYDSLFSFIPKVIHISDFPKFMFEILEIPELHRIKFRNHDTLKTTESISFRDIMRFVFVSQDELGTKNFLRNENTYIRPKNRSAFQLMLQLVSPDYDSIVAQIVENENRIQNLKREISGLNQYLIERNAENKMEKNLELVQVRKSAEELKNRKKKLLDDIKEEKDKESSLYENIQEKTKHIYLEVRFIEELLRDIRFSWTNKTSLLEEYKKELQELLATKETMYRVKLEEQEHVCPLCSSTIKLDAPITSIDSIENVIKQLNNKVRNIDQSIQVNELEIKQKEKKLKELEEQQEIYNTILRKYSRKTELPYISELEGINSYIKTIEEKEYILLEISRVYKKIEEKEFEISKVIRILEMLREKEKALKVEEKYEQEVLRFLDKEYCEGLKRFHFNPNPLDTKIDRKDYSPIFADASVFAHESGGLLMCIQISYLGSILKRKIVDFEVNHPGFLMLDTLSKYLGTNKSSEEGERLDPKSYAAIYQYLIDLAKDYQIFAVDNTPPELADEYVKYTFARVPDDLKGFIDLSKNELKKK